MKIVLLLVHGIFPCQSENVHPCCWSSCGVYVALELKRFRVADECSRQGTSIDHVSCSLSWEKGPFEAEFTPLKDEVQLSLGPWNVISQEHRITVRVLPVPHSVRSGKSPVRSAFFHCGHLGLRSLIGYREINPNTSCSIVKDQKFAPNNSQRNSKAHFSKLS